MTTQRHRTMMNARALTGLAVALVLVAASHRGGAQQATSPPPSNDQQAAGAELSAKRLAELTKAAREYQIVLDTEPPTPLTLHAEPLLRWTNPVRQGADGAVFLWVADGRPAVVASFYRAKRGGTLIEDHEFESLALTGLTATSDARNVWFPRRPGVTLLSIPGAAAPATTPSERLRQMRSLANQFKAFVDPPPRQTELRLLAKPLYRYEAERANRVDGALFAFVLATDPEVLLLIEANADDGALAWHYGLARMSLFELRAEFKEQVVWRVDRDNDRFAPDKPYVTVREGPVPAEDEAVPDLPLKNP